MNRNDEMQWDFYKVDENLNKKRKNHIPREPTPEILVTGVPTNLVDDISDEFITAILTEAEHPSLYAISPLGSITKRFPKDLRYIKGLKLELAIRLWKTIIKLSAANRIPQVHCVRIYVDMDGEARIVLCSVKFPNTIVPLLCSKVTSLHEEMFGIPCVYVYFKEFKNRPNEFTINSVPGY